MAAEGERRKHAHGRERCPSAYWRGCGGVVGGCARVGRIVLPAGGGDWRNGHAGREGGLRVLGGREDARLRVVRADGLRVRRRAGRLVPGRRGCVCRGDRRGRTRFRADRVRALLREAVRALLRLRLLREGSRRVRAAVQRPPERLPLRGLRVPERPRPRRRHRGAARKPLPRAREGGLRLPRRAADETDVRRGHGGRSTARSATAGTSRFPPRRASRGRRGASAWTAGTARSGSSAS